MNKYLKEILNKMCSIVGTTYDKIDFKSDDWYLQYEWTEKQEEEFRRWLIDYLYINDRARRELTACVKQKSHISKAVSMFLLCYGWALSEKGK